MALGSPGLDPQYMETLQCKTEWKRGLDLRRVLSASTSQLPNLGPLFLDLQECWIYEFVIEESNVPIDDHLILYIISPSNESPVSLPICDFTRLLVSSDCFSGHHVSQELKRNRARGLLFRCDVRPLHGNQVEQAAFHRFVIALYSRIIGPLSTRFCPRTHDVAEISPQDRQPGATAMLQPTPEELPDLA